MDLIRKAKQLSTSRQCETILTTLTIVFPSPMYQAYLYPQEFASHGLNFLIEPSPYPNTPGGAIIWVLTYPSSPAFRMLRQRIFSALCEIKRETKLTNGMSTWSWKKSNESFLISSSDTRLIGDAIPSVQTRIWHPSGHPWGFAGMYDNTKAIRAAVASSKLICGAEILCKFWQTYHILPPFALTNN